MLVRHISCSTWIVFARLGSEETNISHVKYVTSGGEGMTMMGRISGGSASRIELPFMILKNRDCNYPIRGVPDNIPGVCYRTGPKGWIDRRVMKLWVQERRTMPLLPDGRKRILVMDHCSGHNLTEELKNALNSFKTEIRFFPPNATDLLQSADSFVIQKLKAAWNKRWDKYKLEVLRRPENVETYGIQSGVIQNPGKSYFLKLAAAVVRDVNAQRGENGLSYARKAMIFFGLARNTNGLWEVRQLFPHLQNIIAKYRGNFDGQDPDSTLESE